jgi:hypothetical protein
MKLKLEGDEGRKLYSKRKSVEEPVNGWIKSVLGLPTVQPERFAEDLRGVGLGLSCTELTPLESNA